MMQPYDLAKLILAMHKRDPNNRETGTYITDLYLTVGEDEAQSLLRQAKNEDADRRRRIAMVAGR